MARKYGLRIVRDQKEREIEATLRYGIIGYEVYRGEQYYSPCGLEPSPLEALTLKSKAKSLHGYQAYEHYFAVAIFPNGALREIYSSSDYKGYAIRSKDLQKKHPKISYDFFRYFLERENKGL